LLVGSTSARANFNNGTRTAYLQLEGTSGTNIDSSSIALIYNQNSTGNASNIYFGKTRGGSDGDNSALNATDDRLGNITFQGNDGTQFVDAAHIRAFTDGTPGADDMPGRLVFSTTADGASSPTERLRIDSSGRLLIGSTQNANNDQLQVNNAGGSNLGLSRFSANAGGPDLFLIKSRDTTVGDHTTVADNDVLGQIRFRGDDGSNYIEGCRIFAEVNGSVSTGSIPTDIVFGTGTTGTERVRITSGGKLGIGTDSPDVTLSINDSTAGSSAVNIGLYNYGTQHGNLYFYKNNVAEAYVKYRGDNEALIIGNNSNDSIKITGDGGVTITGITTFSNTGSIRVPVGTTAERANNVAGAFRYNSTTGGFEGYTTEWGEIGGGGEIRRREIQKDLIFT
jgi:hypothetical protein